MLGIDPALLPADPDAGFALWEAHRPAWEAFAAVAGQWRTVPREHRTVWLGLDYQAAQAGLALAGIAVDPETWAEVRMIEAGARGALNGG